MNRMVLDCFYQIHRMPMHQVDTFRRQVIARLDACFMQLLQSVSSRTSRDRIKLLFIAYIDEWVTKRKPDWQHYWSSHSLQLHYFQKIDAGHQVSQAIELMQQQPAPEYALYALIFLLGYRGHCLWQDQAMIATERQACQQIILRHFPRQDSVPQQPALFLRYRTVALFLLLGCLLIYLVSMIGSHWYLSWLD